MTGIIAFDSMTATSRCSNARRARDSGSRVSLWFCRGRAGLEAVGVAGTREVILEAYPGFDSISSPLDDPPVTGRGVHHRNAATLLVDAPRPGLLYASESFFDGWTASVNGAPAPILPANYAFRAVVVPQGRSRVEFKGLRPRG